jgi:predicted nucleotidyltransferase component of viral defense system
MAVEGRVRSIQDRLVQIAKRRNVPHTEILQNYGLERFLYRISRSPHCDRFILKGALVLQIWQGASARPTRDIDLLGPPSLTASEIEGIIADWLALDGGDDGVTFSKDSLAVVPIRAQVEQVGFRVQFDGHLGTSRLRFQVDIGVGDAVSPAPVLCDYPTLLDMPAPRLLAYTPYTIVAEKFEALVTLGEANSRMKDYFDLSHLAAQEGFDGLVLQVAIRSAFAARGTVVPASVPVGLERAFGELPQKQAQWTSFLRNRRQSGLRLEDAVVQARAFLMPLCKAERRGERFEGEWKPGGPWER